LDVVVRGEDGRSVTLVAAQIEMERLVMLGTLIDPEIPVRVDTSIAVSFAPELVSGTHVQRSSELTVIMGEVESSVQWEIETRELGDGYALQDMRAWGDNEQFRGFAIEDLTATVGIGIAAGVGALIAWRTHKREQHAREDAERKWRSCLENGGTPTIEYGVKDEAGVEGPRVTVGSSYHVRVRCDPARRRSALA
jgi:hypothetical protein